MQEKFRKLLELNEMFGGMIDLIDPSRELIKEGKMVKISARNGVHYDRYLLLVRHREVAKIQRQSF